MARGTGSGHWSPFARAEEMRGHEEVKPPGNPEVTAALWVERAL